MGGGQCEGWEEGSVRGGAYVRGGAGWRGEACVRGGVGWGEGEGGVSTGCSIYYGVLTLITTLPSS